MTSVQHEIYKYVLSGDPDSIKEFFKREEVSEEPQAKDLFGLKDESGRNALLTACMLGRSAIARELVTNGAQVDERTVRGYTSLHLAACWGHLETVRTLLQLGADTQTETFRGDRPVDLAKRYFRTDCADCLILAEAKQDLMLYIAFVKNLTSDPEINLTKDEKIICTRISSAKSEWLHTVQHATVSDIIAQRKDIEDTLTPILSKQTATATCK